MPLSDELKRLLRECDVETYRASGPGGQHRNKTESAVRMTHRPTGLKRVATEHRSQLRNRELALTRIARALEARRRKPKPRVATRPGKAAKVARLESKRRESAKKRIRRATPRTTDRARDAGAPAPASGARRTSPPFSVEIRIHRSGRGWNHAVIVRIRLTPWRALVTPAALHGLAQAVLSPWKGLVMLGRCSFAASAALLALLAASVAPMPAHAAEPATASSFADTSKPVTFLKETVVTGARYPQRYFESPQALSFISRSDAARHGARPWSATRSRCSRAWTTPRTARGSSAWCCAASRASACSCSWTACP
jgi:hypothetical protein